MTYIICFQNNILLFSLCYLIEPQIKNAKYIITKMKGRVHNDSWFINAFILSLSVCKFLCCMINSSYLDSTSRKLLCWSSFILKTLSCNLFIELMDSFEQNKLQLNCDLIIELYLFSFGSRLFTSACTWTFNTKSFS